MAGTKFKIGAESKVWKYAVKSTRCIFDLELQFITRVNVKTLIENLKTP